jgi:tRNA (mo5U34)-methyltransferase
MLLCSASMNSPSSLPAPTRSELQALSDSVETWWHSIDLGQGVVTPGKKSHSFIQGELQSLQLPDLHGRTVLDIGAWDGFYSYAAERLGAQRVVALDHFVWSVDLPRAMALWQDCRERGVAAPPVEETPLWQPATLPGKRAFDTAHKALASRVEAVVDDFMTMDCASIGQFDVTFFMGVLYHMKDPLGSLQRLASLTRGMAVIETHAVAIPGWEHLELCEFYSANQLNADVSNWWGPNLRALVGMCQAAGFSRVEVIVDSSHGGGNSRLRTLVTKTLAALRRRPYHYRAVVHAYK